MTDDYRGAANALLSESAADPWAWLTPSVYESARLVADAPWLGGHTERLRHLCERSWGQDGFAFNSTLSATEALLTVLARREEADGAVPRARVRAVAEQGLRVLRDWLAPGGRYAGGPPQTISVELIVPMLVDRINARLAEGVFGGDGVGELPMPDGCATGRLAGIRADAAAGSELPADIWHAWEIATPATPLDGPPHPYAGSVSCSAAGTAGWLRTAPEPGSPAGRFLEELQRYGNGLVPVAAPIDYFEQAWTLNTFTWHAVPHDCPRGILDRLEPELGPYGIAGGRDLTVDGDDTAAVLNALICHGRKADLDGLLTYWTGDHFQIYPGETVPSPATNGHTVSLLRRCLDGDPERYGPLLRRNTAWLLDQQRPDGSWSDFWHVSPYYATVCAVEALSGMDGERAQAAVARARRWVLDTRHPGGGWGVRWVTMEETAYATLILRESTVPGVAEALATAEPVLREGVVDAEITPLWLVKDYFAPIRVVAAAVLAARHALTNRLLVPAN
ncbi:prenyltransferase/squalene oxidase repeat-containing protein [Streptomyces sp. NPDC048172]|uniref:prenyltransferase/squalene oxidase repeat-containing protein n=1 Tax=Streptomyces sp. NPDC048172 TaxID=3365505 RepID=UPI0037242138